ALTLPEIARGTEVRVVRDTATFSRVLEQARPRIVLLGAPPAGSAETELVARERRRRHGLRVVRLAEPGAIETRLEALRLGFDDALSSSIASDELAARLALLEKRALARPERTLPVGDGCELDLVAHELRRDGRVVHLRPKEFDLLAALAARPGRAHTRRQLLDRVWGHGYYGDPRTVDVHVRWLRSKIEVEPDRPAHLLTVRGVGYRLDPAPG
ncbi:MAG TPA: response regulator transcription factor, partial [Clostridia bacterium]|nr:response regulator transcription factor [Clostridia bacterium]